MKLDLPPRLLLGPGPMNLHPRVSLAMARPCIGHLDPSFIELMSVVQEQLRRLFRSQTFLTLPISGPGSAGMDCCFSNILEQGSEILICRNGVFSQRMGILAERLGAQVHYLDSPWGESSDPNLVEDYLKSHPAIEVLAFVHGETSTGVLAPAKDLAELGRRYDCLNVVDTVTTLGGCELEFDAWGFDLAFSGTQKCLSASPGLSPICISERGWARIESMKKPPASYLLDLKLLLSYWRDKTQKRSYHHTAPIHAIYGLHEALTLIEEEGLENVQQRHLKTQSQLAESLSNLGLELAVKKEIRLPSLTSVRLPSSWDEAKLRQDLLNKYNIEIGAGLGELAGKIWRVGMMGYNATSCNVLRLYGALKDLLEKQ